MLHIDQKIEVDAKDRKCKYRMKYFNEFFQSLFDYYPLPQYVLNAPLPVNNC
jgi:hypothetical protein